MSLALGDINAAVLNGIADKLSGIVGALPAQESAVLTSVITQLSSHAEAMEKIALDAIGEYETRLLDSLDALQAFLAPFSDFSNGFTVEVTPKSKKDSPQK